MSDKFLRTKESKRDFIMRFVKNQTLERAVREIKTEKIPISEDSEVIEEVYNYALDRTIEILLGMRDVD